MTSLNETLRFYKDYDWSHGGEEWADQWGGSDMQWHGTILPRIHRFIPAGRILEIGAGFGRWVPYLATYCDELLLVDMTSECVDFLKDRFAHTDSIQQFLNDGLSTPQIESQSIGFAFSFHALVHANNETMAKYVAELSRVLTADGVAFIHHSNAKKYANDSEMDIELLSDYRDISVSSDTVREMVEKNNLICCSQEEVNWETEELLDCFSVIARPMSLWGRSENRFRNNGFLQEMAYWGKLAKVYSDGQTEAIRPLVYRMKGKPEATE